MPSWVAWLIAAVSTTAFLVLWFWEVRRVLRSRRSVVESAAAQLALLLHMSRADRHDAVAVQLLAGLIDDKAAVSVTVKRNTEVEITAADAFL